MRAWIEVYHQDVNIEGFDLPENKHEILIQDENHNTIMSIPIQRPLPCMGINVVDGELLSKATQSFQIENRRSVLNPMALELAGIELNPEWMHNEEW